MQADTISIFGMGRLGVCLAAILASKNYSVTGVDTDPDLVDRINSGHAPFDEPGLQELITEGRSRLRATTHPGEAVAASRISVIFVATPQDPDGVMSSVHVRAAAAAIGDALTLKSEYHLVILSSTVLPGMAESEILPTLEMHSGRRCGVDFGFCYVPEFVATGTVIKNMLEPEMIVVGERESGTWPAIEAFHKGYLRNNPRVFRMNIANAGMVKIATNVLAATKICYSNILAGLCERVPGADVDVVTQAIAGSSIAGAKIFSGGTPYGGPCYPKDIRSFAAFLDRMDLPPTLFNAVEAMNNSINPGIAACVQQLLDGQNGGRSVGIFGLAFKPGSSSIANSPGIALAELLLEQSCEVIVHDPLALDAARKILGVRVRYEADPGKCLAACTAAVFVNPDPCYRSLTAGFFESHTGPLAVVDCWRMFRFLAEVKSIRYHPLGLHHVHDGIPAPSTGEGLFAGPASHSI